MAGCRTHEPTSALAFLGFVVVTAPHWRLSQIAAGLVVAAGAGILPDFDLPGAAPSYTLGWPTKKLSEGVNWVAQKTATSQGSWVPGHRQITHCALATAGITLLAKLMVGAVDWRWQVGLIAVCTLLCVRVLGPKEARRSIVAGCVLTALVTYLIWRWVTPGAWEWAAVGLGYAGHLAEDMFSGRIPLFWPLKFRVGFTVRLPGRKRRFALIPLNSVREHIEALAAWAAIGFLFYGIAR